MILRKIQKFPVENECILAFSAVSQSRTSGKCYFFFLCVCVWIVTISVCSKGTNFKLRILQARTGTFAKRCIKIGKMYKCGRNI